MNTPSTPALVERLRDAASTLACSSVSMPYMASICSEAADALSTPAPRISSPEAKVKPLEWDQINKAEPETLRANGLAYEIRIDLLGRMKGNPKSVTALVIEAGESYGDYLGYFETPEEAEAFCQADFEKRILSSLAPSSPAGEPELVKRLLEDAATIERVYGSTSGGQHFSESLRLAAAALATPPARALPGITEEMVEAAKAAFSKAYGAGLSRTDAGWKDNTDKALRAALEAASISRPAEREGWRTMESAPKDGTRVELWHKSADVLGGYPVHGSWRVRSRSPVAWRSDNGARLQASHWRPQASSPPTPSTDHVGGGE